MSHLSLETLKTKKTPGQLVAGRFRPRSSRFYNIEYKWQGMVLASIAMLGVVVGPVAAGTLMYDVPAEDGMSGTQFLSILPFALSGIVASGSLGIGYLFGPEAIGAFGIPKEATNFHDLSWFMKRRVIKKMAAEDKVIGWRPRNGLPHIKGQLDTHDRFRTRMVVNEEKAVATLFIQHWVYNNQRQLWGVTNDIQSKEFSAKETHLIHAYYEQLHAKADQLEQQVEKDLATARDNNIVEGAALEHKLLEDVVIKERREQERKETVAQLLAMSSVLDNH